MRLRNIKNAKEILNNTELVVKEPSLYKGKWASVFDNKNPIHIEIGMGLGDFIFNMAIKYPDMNFIGIEKFDNVLVRAVKKHSELILPNLKLIRLDALDLADVFCSEITRVYLNHSDPWPKEKHIKRRLTSPVFSDIYKQITISDTCVSLQTDNLELFNYSLDALVDNGYEISVKHLDYYNLTGVMTEYEKKFRDKGHKIYYLEAICKQDK